MRTINTVSYIVILWLAGCFAQLSGQQTATDGVQVLMLEACTFDPYYSEQIASTLGQIATDIAVTSYTYESVDPLETALEGKDLALVVYPHKGAQAQLSQWGNALRTFAQKGGVVVFTGTHEISKINFFNLLNFEKGTYNPSPQVQILQKVLFTKSLPDAFTSANYTYPVVPADPNYVSLAQDSDRSVYGYSKLGKGLIFYVGLEFYHLESVNRTILDNLVYFVRTQKAKKNTPTLAAKQPAELPDLRNLAILPNAAVEWNIYPNPYVSRTQAEFM